MINADELLRPYASDDSEMSITEKLDRNAKLFRTVGILETTMGASDQEAAELLAPVLGKLILTNDRFIPADDALVLVGLGLRAAKAAEEAQMHAAATELATLMVLTELAADEAQQEVEDDGFDFDIAAMEAELKALGLI